MPRPDGIVDPLQPAWHDEEARQPVNPLTGAQLADLLFGRHPPGEAADPRAGSTHRTSG